jgi:hypothetical protein
MLGTNNLYLNYPGINDLRKELKKHLYLVRVPQVATYDPSEVELLGLPLDVLKDGRTKNENYKRLSTVMLSLDKILEIYTRGFSIRVVNREDTIDIAEKLSKFADILERSPNLKNLEIVNIIDDFLQNVVNYNRKLIEKKIKDEEKELEEDLGLDFFETSPTSMPDYLSKTKVRR